MIHAFNKPIPVTTKLGDGYAIYVNPSGPLKDDKWCVVMKNGGQVRHFLSNQIRIYEITPEETQVSVEVDQPKIDQVSQEELYQDLRSL